MHVSQVNNIFILVGLKSGPVHAYQDFEFKKILENVD